MFALTLWNDLKLQRVDNDKYWYYTRRMIESKIIVTFFFWRIEKTRWSGELFFNTSNHVKLFAKTKIHHLKATYTRLPCLLTCICPAFQQQFCNDTGFLAGSHHHKQPSQLYLAPYLLIVQNKKIMQRETWQSWRNTSTITLSLHKRYI